jgi:hypothetical protein
MIDALAMFKHGGAWLGRARAWMQNHKHNGSRVTWGSNEVLQPPMTVQEVEDVARISAVAAINEDKAPRVLGEILELLDQGVLVPKENVTGEEHFNLIRALREAAPYRKVKA